MKYISVFLFKKEKKGWKTAFVPAQMKGVKLTHDLINAKTGEVVMTAGEKLNLGKANKLKKDGLEEYIVPTETIDGNSFTVFRTDDGAFNIEAEWLVRILNGTNVEDYESLQYFQRRLRDSGIIAKLEEMGVKEGDTIRIEDFEFEFVY